MVGTVSPPLDDLSSLAWVQAELRRALEAANKALRRYLKESSGTHDLDSVDPSVLRQARNQLHQSVGVLELVGLGQPAKVLRAAEAALQTLANKPRQITLQTIHTIEHGNFAVLDFIARRLAAKPVSTLALFPQYRALNELFGNARIHPCDLWDHEWSWRSVPADRSVAPLYADAELLERLETGLLQLMRGVAPATAAQMSDLFAGLGAATPDDGDAGAPGPDSHLATLWRLASGFFEALADGRLALDVYSKRVGSRLLAQLRAGDHGEPSARLAEEMLFFCSLAWARAGRGEGAPGCGVRLAAVRDAWKLPEEPAADLDVPRLGRFDPAWVQQARKRIQTAKDVWSSAAGGDTDRLSLLAEQFSLVADSLQRLYPDGGVLGRALQVAAAQTAASGQSPAAPLAMEVATALLYVEASIEDADFDLPDTAARVNRLAQRIEQVRLGRDPGTLELWMEELYRRVSDRQTMGSVVQELRSSLSEVEKHIDQYFRDPSQRQVLIPVPAQLQAMRGVLSLLALDQASAAVLRMSEDVDALANTEVDPQQAIRAGTFDRLADNLGALSFLIDMVSVQPQMAKSLFHFDSDTGNLTSTVARQERPTGFEDLQSGLGAQDTDAMAVTLEFDRLVDKASRRRRGGPIERGVGTHGLPLLQFDDAGEAANVAADAAADVDAGAAQPTVTALHLPGLTQPDQPTQRLDAPTVMLAAAPTVLSAAPTQPMTSGLEDDAEMRGVFLEEAREVLQSAREGLFALDAEPGDQSVLTSVRRAFHTLKGSARMVGLPAFAEAAWACEQLYNARLAEHAASDAPLRDFSRRACDHFAAWVDALSAGDASAFQPTLLAEEADALRLRHTASKAGAALPVAVAPAAPALADFAERTAAVLAPPSTPPREATAAGLAEHVPGLPSADDLRLDLPLDDEPAAALAPLDLSLSDLDDAGAVPEQAAPAAAERGAGAGTESAAVPMLALPEALELPSSAWPEPVDLALEATAPLADTPAAADAAPPAAAEPPADDYKQVGPLRISLPLFNIYTSEADELSQRLASELAEWSQAPQHAVPGDTVALAHSLAGGSGTVGYAELSQLARHLEHALERSRARGHGNATEAALFSHAGDEIRRLLGLFSAGQLYSPDAALVQALHDLAHAPRDSAHQVAADSAAGALDDDAEESVDTAYDIEVAALDAFSADADAVAVPAADAAPAPPAPPAPATLLADAPADRPVDEPVDEPAAVPADEPSAAPADAPAPAAASVVTPVAPSLPVAPALPVLAAIAPAVAPPVAMRLPPLPAAAAGLAGRPAMAQAVRLADDIDAVDAVDAELFPIFVDEARELLPRLQGALRDWARQPGDAAAAQSSGMRALHTFKGGARLAGAMKLGEMAHRLETALAQLAAGAHSAAEVEHLLGQVDLLEAHVEALLNPAADAPAPVSAARPGASRSEPSVAALLALPPVLGEVEPTAPAAPSAAEAAAPSAAEATTPMAPIAAPAEPVAATEPVARRTAALAPAPAAAPVLRRIDWSRFSAAPAPSPAAATTARPTPGGGSVRVRAALLDRLVNEAGEVSIARSRIEGDVQQLKGAFVDLADNLERLRAQLRDIELQAESQIATRLEAARSAAKDFDPLEMDRFTRFQELTRMMAESVADVATVQRGLQRAVQSTEDALAHQARMTRDMQDDLLRTRMVEFEGASERLYRVVRQAAKEMAKPVRLDIVGGSIEIDRGVLDRMTPAFEHLLRNSVVHGIEPAAQRQSAGKDLTGSVTLTVSQLGNEVTVEVRDDGAGLNLPLIRERALAHGLLAADSPADDATVGNLIFHHGFTTADAVTDLAGRGVGMDVVRTDVNAMGGRIETASSPGRGTAFRVVLPLTTAVTQVVLARCGERHIAVPATLVERVRRVPPVDVATAYRDGRFEHDGAQLPFHWLDALLEGTPRGALSERNSLVLVVRSADQRIALHVDEVTANQEVVIKNLGPQLSALPGLVGMTLLASGLPALIYNPVALVTLYGEAARRATQAALAAEGSLPGEPAAALPQAPLVLVVDDSLTVRRVTQRLLEREGYRVALAKDGLDALEQLGGELPAVVLTDIEMPRMDGFDLVRNIKANERLAALPLIMITSRIAQKHRDYAVELGVDHYLGKPYPEDQLLALIARFCRTRPAPAATGQRAALTAA